ncbi:MAG: ABC transporter permease [Phycisphaerales bacterium]|nr:MAG: ABC transporter permease [Phycisphaerales bacterium]
MEVKQNAGSKKAVATSDTASLDFQQLEGGTLRLVVKGSLDAESAGRLWTTTLAKVGKSRAEVVEVDAEGLESCDAAGIALLLELKTRQETQGKAFRLHGLRGDLAELMDLFDPGPPSKPAKSRGLVGSTIERVGEATVGLAHDFQDYVSFTGEVFAKLLGLLLHPGRLRWGDTFLVAEKAGADGVGIVSLLGFLIGVILAFQSAIAMGKFGADIYVADLVTIVLFRELGPLITAFILASRSSSAFAAELGTMKLNEEIDALTTMGIDPVQFLVFPRLIAGTAVLPLLTVFNILLGLIGCGLVMVAIGFTPKIVFDEIYEAANLTDFFTGLVKTLVFGALVAGIGCLRGLRTGTGASAVGDSTTRAVVSSIIAIVVADGVFAVVYYLLDI